ncbi:hypothetical protein N7532_002978 [Penicillium argentinense]|uniref:Uncharacterized protein n=1 Tax=Penicillium argentinense TaxID=1131581 RepID=A0A9W9KDK4_9EURO|nr:uncharacterized protein N7532_002978 [Penicillium argentinense]KAJ5102449.1 hypothetical protein N7532_002978 [Penicillium argentinense]
MAAGPGDETLVNETSEDDIEYYRHHQDDPVELGLADDEGCETVPQIPEWYVEDSPHLVHKNSSSTDLEYATEKLAQQFLVGIHGCSAQKHRESLAAHIEAEESCNHHKLDQLFHHAIPRTLDKSQLFPRQALQEETPLVPDQWREIFSGTTPQYRDGKPKQVCLHAERSQKMPSMTSFDVDSILGFVDSPAVAVHGIRFYSAPQYYQNIHSDVHITIKREAGSHQRPRLLTSRLKDVPHFLFARVEGADFLTLHIFFPHLPHYCDFTRLTDEQFSRWFDQIFYPALRQVCAVDHLQHLPASYQHALATCRASRVENCLRDTPGHQPQLQMSYFLPPQCLAQLWHCILATVTQLGLQDFREPELLVEAKGTKLRFKSAATPSDMLAVLENFDRELHRTLDFSHVWHDRLYVDVGKEVCPPHVIPSEDTGGVPPHEPQTYLWRRCCLRHHLHQLYDGDVPKSNQNFYHESMLRDAGSLTTLTPARSRLRRGGVLYGQMYNLTKEIIDATRTFPFQNPDLRQLALDSQLRNSAQSLRKMSPRANGVTERAYLASKRRCHYGLMDSRQRAFGIREEYRISWALFHGLIAVLRSLRRVNLSTRFLEPPQHVWVIRTADFVDFVWHNLNKFTTGFELVRARCSPGLTTWEQTKMMDMLLSCLRVAVGGHDYSRQGSLWWSRRECPPRPARPMQVQYGLGFSQTLEQYGYCWLEPRIDWTRMTFLPDITDLVLFGSGTLQRRYLQCGGHIQHFFDLSRRADWGLEWLQQHPNEDVITNRILSWLVHLCLRQMRLDTLRAVRRDIPPDIRSAILDDQIQFCRSGLSAILPRGMTAVTGNRTSIKSPQEAARALFGFDDGRLRVNWDNKPFRTLYQRICAALQQVPADRRLPHVFANRLLRYLFEYHWVLPYPSSYELMQKTKHGNHRWYSLDLRPDSHLNPEHAALDDWCWARNKWRPGCPAPVPRCLDWDKHQWQSWIDRHRGPQPADIPWELQFDLDSSAYHLSKFPNEAHRYPVRSTRRIIWDVDEGPDSSLTDAEVVPGSMHISESPVGRSTSEANLMEPNSASEGQEGSDTINEPLLQPPDLQTVPSSQLRLQQYESELQCEVAVHQQMEQSLATVRKWITYGCELAFRQQELAQIQSSIQGSMTLFGASPVVTQVQPTPNLARPVEIHQPSRRMTANHHRSQRQGHNPSGKRGRPPKYATRQERLAANAYRRRVKRQREASNRQIVAGDHNTTTPGWRLF